MRWVKCIGLVWGTELLTVVALKPLIDSLSVVPAYFIGWFFGCFLIKGNWNTLSVLGIASWIAAPGIALLMYLFFGATTP